MDAKAKLNQFVASVTEPLSDQIFDAVEKFQNRASMMLLKAEVAKVTQIQAKNDDLAIIG